MAGLISTLVSAVVVPTSNHRSLKAAGKYVTHDWKIKVDEISVEVDCTGTIIRGPGHFDYDKQAILKWVARVKELDFKKLANKDEIKVTSEVEFRSREKGEKLWTISDQSRDVTIKLGGSAQNEKLKITLSDKWRDGRSVAGLGTFGVFDCSLPMKKRIETEKSYFASLETFEVGAYEFIRTKDPVDIKVKLAECSWNKEEKEFECNLKVTYEDSLDWSEKVTAKARISFE